jgi:exosome complex RNA-binding protein Rrp42 (RNase PH superfamily)
MICFFLKKVLRYEGNLHDACSFAMKAALSETK